MTTHVDPPAGGSAPRRAATHDAEHLQDPSTSALPLEALGPEASPLHLAQGRPEPGARPPRAESDVAGAEPHAGAADAAPSAHTVPARPRSWSLQRDYGAHDQHQARGGARTQSKTAPRVSAIDSARGLAFLGMVAVHTLPAWNEATQSATVQWDLFAGHAAALFAVLAGVSLAFLSGGSKGLARGRAASVRFSIMVRALLIFLIGLTLNLVDIAQHSILIYYGIMFLLVIPFLRMRVPALLASAAVFMVGGPFLMQWSLQYLPEPTHNPNILDLVAHPVRLVSQVLLTGVYPVIPWMTFVLVGLAIGRLNIRKASTGAWLLVAGIPTAIIAYCVSMAWLLRLGGYEAIASATTWMDESSIDEIIVFGPDPHLPTTTLAWLIIPGPHTNTPFALAFSLGLAVAVIGALLLLGQRLRFLTKPFAAMGTMTLTLYIAHLLVLQVMPYEESPWPVFAAQMGGAALFALAWSTVLGRGPLERVVTWISKGAGRLIPQR